MLTCWAGITWRKNINQLVFRFFSITSSPFLRGKKHRKNEPTVFGRINRALRLVNSRKPSKLVIDPVKKLSNMFSKKVAKTKF